MITNQEIFDVAWQAFVVEQRPPSVTIHPDTRKRNCLYRSPEGHKCAIGLCIRDDDYDPDMEMQSPLDLDGHFGLKFERPLFAADAQTALHDELTEKLGKPEHHSYIEERYLEFARRWDLEVPEAA